MMTPLIMATLLVLFRCAGFVAFLPPVAGQALPNTVKVGFAIALTAVFAPHYVLETALYLSSFSEGPAGWVRLAFLTIRETVLGISLAWMLGLCLIPARVAGSWIAQEMGLTMATITSAANQQQTNVVSQLLEAFSVLLFFALNLHHVMFFSLDGTFRMRHPGGCWLMPSWEEIVYRVASADSQGLLIVAPVALVMFIITMTLLVTMRATPQFNFMSYGMSLRVIAGLCGMVLFLPEILGSMQSFLMESGLRSIR